MKILLPLSIVIYAIIFQNLLFIIFPFPGPGTIGTVPLSIGLSLLLAIIFFLVTYLVKTFKYKYLLYILFQFFSTYFYILIYPSNPFYLVKKAFKISNELDKIKYNDIFFYDPDHESLISIAALAKFKDTIPDFAVVVSYCCRKEKEFVLSKYGNKFNTNNEHLKINFNKNKDTIIFSEKFYGEVLYIKDKPELFGKTTHWGELKHYEKVTKTSIFFRECSLKTTGGFYDWYYKYLIRKLNQ
jgi:hypothetical protein